MPKDIPQNQRYYTHFYGESMNHRLLDALDLLKMLEVVFEQRQALELNGESNSKASGSSTFPWSGVRLTLRQSRELLQELQESQAPVNNRQTQVSQTPDNLSYEHAVTSQHNQRSIPPREASYAEVREKNYRGTFNRIQLTQEPQVLSSEEKAGAAPVAR